MLRWRYSHADVRSLGTTGSDRGCGSWTPLGRLHSVVSHRDVELPDASPSDAAIGVGLLAFIFVPELVVYAGLVQKARGRAFWSDPYGMWVAAIASSVLWVWVFSADVSEDRQALLILASAVLIIASSVVGLIAARQQRRLTGG